MAAGFALFVVGAAGAVAIWGLPAWADDFLVPAAANEPELIIELPVQSQEHRTLANGVILFAANGSIVNPTDKPQRVLPIRAELRDNSGAVVFEWIINPPIAVLPAGERRAFSSARTDVPRRAVMLTASWAQPR